MLVLESPNLFLTIAVVLLLLELLLQVAISNDIFSSLALFLLANSHK